LDEAMTELKPCPFCGGEATQPAQNPERAWCTNENCIMAFKIVLKRTWNTRPAPSPSDADDDDFVLAPVKAGKPAPSPSREGWPLTLADVQALRGNAKRRANAGFTHVEVAVGDELALCDMALSALRPAGDEGLRVAAEGVCSWAWGDTRLPIFHDDCPDTEAMRLDLAALEAALHTEKKEGL
jgi:hypothetical protein